MNQKTTPRDFFLHLGAVIALYTSAIALMNLAFAIVNKALPDALSNYWSAGSIVWPISMLVVLVPVLYVIEWFIIHDIARMPEKKDIWVRKWRIYLTLFLTGATIAGDLIALINTYLNGEVTGRFMAKVAVVFVVAGCVFAYYILARIAASSGATKVWRDILAWVGIVLVLGTIVGGFVIVGSPATQRSLRFDEQRVLDLSTLQYQIVDYWQKNAKLPDSIQALTDPISGFMVPTDPENGASYEYSVDQAPSFELCATFDLPSSAQPSGSATGYAIYNSPMMLAGGMTNETWNHSAGRTCFSRTIDPNLYPAVPEK
jgi:hypothetical protein